MIIILNIAIRAYTIMNVVSGTRGWEWDMARENFAECGHEAREYDRAWQVTSPL